MINNYLVTIKDRATDQVSKIIVRSSCACDMSAFVEELAQTGAESFVDPVVVDIEEQRVPLPTAV